MQKRGRQLLSKASYQLTPYMALQDECLLKFVCCSVGRPFVELSLVSSSAKPKECVL